MKNYLVILLMLISHLGFSWGSQGHEMVAEIAKTYTGKTAQDSVNKYFDGLTWEKAATWMDEVRSNHKFDYLKPLHYVNIEKDKTRVETLRADTEHPQSIVDELSRILAEDFKKPIELSADTMKQDLLELFHLVGDYHQPLHVGYGDDKGGNTVEVDYHGKIVNLHHLWDSDLVKAHLKEIQDELTTLCKTISKQEIARIQKTDLTEWLNEGRALLPQVYGFKGNVISDDYETAAIKIIEQQLFYAGVRLAGVLNTSFVKM